MPESIGVDRALRLFSSYLQLSGIAVVVLTAAGRWIWRRLPFGHRQPIADPAGAGA